MQLDFSDFHVQGTSLWCKVVVILFIDTPCNLPTYEDPSRFYSHGLDF